MWDEGTCSCGCPLKSLETSCPYGEVYSDQACACIPESEAILLDKAAISEHRDDDDLFAQFSLEHILILVLATIILILLAILATLCTKIRSMSRRIRHLPGGGSPNGNGHLLTDSDLDVKQLHPGNPVYREGSCSTPSSGFYSEIAANERNYQQKRESDSMYHSAESVRLKKQRMELNGMCGGNGGNEMVLRENELALREEGLETSSSVSRSRINIIENVLVGEDEGFIRFCPEDGSSHQIPPRMHTMEIDTRISPAGAMPKLDTNGGQCEYGTVKRPRPRLLIEEPVGACGDGNGSGRNSPVLYGKLRLDGGGSQITTNGSLKKVKPPIPPPKSPRIYSHIVGASNGHPAAGNSYPSTPQMAHQSLVVTASDAQCQLKSSGGNNFANPHIDEALRLLQESANNL